MSTPIEKFKVPATEFSEEFVEAARKRMAVSYHKYGAVRDGMERGAVKAIDSGLLRIQKYLETGNTEWLIDAANFMMMEFMFTQHPEAHYRPTDSDESPGRVHITSAPGTKPTRTSDKANLDI